MQEVTFFHDQNVLITNSRAVFNGVTYSTANVTSVLMGKISATRWPGILLAIAGLLFSGCCGFGSIMAIAATSQTRDGSGAGAFVPIAGLLFWICITALGIWLAIAAKPKYAVVIRSSSTESHAIISKNSQYIEGIVAALNNAIVYRG